MDIREEIFEAIKEIKPEIVELNVESLFKEDLGIDSVKGFRLLMTLEKKNIAFKEETNKSIVKVIDLIESMEIKK